MKVFHFIGNITKAAFLFMLMALLFSSSLFAAEDSAFPYELNSTQEIILSAVVLSTFGTTLYLASGYEEPSASEIQNLNKNDINSFDRSATENWSTGLSSASHMCLFSLGTAPFVLYAPFLWTDKWSNYWTISVMYLQAATLNFGLTELTKSLVGRKRPYLYNTSLSIDERMEKAENPSSQRSFYSGHVSITFCSAVFISKVYSDLNPNSISKYLLWGITLGISSTTGYLRYAEGVHYPSDIIVGALMGSAVGYLVPLLHKKNNNNTNIAIYPITGEQPGLSIVLEF